VGQWVVFRLQGGEVQDYTADLTSDAAFGRMMQLSGTTWLIVAKRRLSPRHDAHVPRA
jgi:hypothetical protein